MSAPTRDPVTMDGWYEETRFVLLSRDGDRARYRVCGGELAPEWAASARPGIPAWCEIVVYDGDPRVASFGGEVWPSAWPALFGSSRGTAQTGPQTWLTDAGLEALGESCSIVDAPICGEPQ